MKKKTVRVYRRQLPSYERVRELFDYDPKTGKLTWRKSPVNGMRDGQEVGCKNPAGHRVGNIKGKTYVLHRIIWLWMTGEQPPNEIDHKNGIASDNRWSNLRAATASQNHWNVGIQKRSKSGFKGVTPHIGGRWFVKIAKDGKQIYLGLFDTPEEGSAVYFAKAKELFGEFARAR